MKRSRSIEKKTAICLGFSTVLHAGFIYYIAASQFGSANGTGFDHASETTVDIVSFSTETTPAPAPTTEIKEPVIEIEKPNEVPAEAPPEKSPAPKAPARLPVKSASKIAEAEKMDTPVVDDAPVAVAQTENAAQESVVKETPIEETAADQTKVVANEPTKEQVAPTNEQAKIDQTPVEPVKEEPTPIEPQPMPPLEQQASAPSQEPSPSPAAAPVATSANPPQGNTSQTEATAAAAMPVRQHSDLRSMPGNKDPEYTMGDRLAKRQGEVKFMGEVTPAGNVTNIRLLKSSGHKSLDVAALKSFKDYRYYPGQQGYVLKSFRFVLKGPAQQLPSRLAERGN